MSQTQSNQKITFPANSKDFFKVENNFPINKLLLQYLKKESMNSLNKNTSFEKQTQIVRPFEFKIASLKETNDPEILFAKSNSDSFILAIQDEQTNCAGLIYFPIIENFFKNDEGKNIFDIIEELDAELNKEESKFDVSRDGMKESLRKTTNDLEEKLWQIGNKLNDLNHGSLKDFACDASCFNQIVQDGFVKNEELIETAEKELEKQRNRMQVLFNFYKIGLKKFFDNFNQKNAKLASSFSENQNDEKSNLIIHIHGCRFEQIMDLIISEIHQNCQEKYNPILGSYNFNFINGGQIIVSDNEKFFAIDVTNREFFQDHSKEFYEKEIRYKNSLDEKDFQKKLSMIKDNQYDVIEESAPSPETNIILGYINWILSFLKVTGV